MNAREVKARSIVASGNITGRNGVYFVPSQSSYGRYRVALGGLFPTCTCEDHELTAGECKHILAAQLWRDQGEQSVPAAELPPPAKRKTYRQDWPNYNKAQNREKDRLQE